jgi:hypothetical protein
MKTKNNTAFWMGAVAASLEFLFETGKITSNDVPALAEIFRQEECDLLPELKELATTR